MMSPTSSLTSIRSGQEDRVGDDGHSHPFRRSAPFVPFEVVTVDGRVLLVPHSDFVTLERYAAALVIYDESARAEIIDPNLIVSVRTLQPLE